MSTKSPCAKCEQLEMDRVHGKFHWVCVHPRIGKDSGTAAEVSAKNWLGLPLHCPLDLRETKQATDQDEGVHA